jgi:predicted amidophosphoribosyltransferase
MELLKSSIKCDDRYFQHYYLCSYLPLAAGPDDLSISLIRFKQRTQPDLDTWIEDSARLLAALPFPPETIIIRALRHEETTVRPEFPAAIDLLGQTLASRLHCHYYPDLIYKTSSTLPNKHLTRHQRRTQLLDVYRLATAATPLPSDPNPLSPATSSLPLTPPLNPDTPFLIIDDMLTTGSTARAIIRTLRIHLPDCPIRIFTLTRAAYQSTP